MCKTSITADIRATIVKIHRISDEISIITLECPEIAALAKPGNFVNIKVNDTTQPLLRRPFSIHNVRGHHLDIMVKSIGVGTTLFSKSTEGSTVMVLGPLGNSFGQNSKPFHTAILVSGGIGTAPMLFLEKRLAAQGKEVINLVGGRTKTDLLTQNLGNCRLATDDGSAGFKGTVVELLNKELPDLGNRERLQLFACGPHPMLNALAEFCRKQQLACELSLESVMGCGIGICYGCSVEIKNQQGGHNSILLCQEGAIIDSKLL